MVKRRVRISWEWAVLILGILVLSGIIWYSYSNDGLLFSPNLKQVNPVDSVVEVVSDEVGSSGGGINPVPGNPRQWQNTISLGQSYCLTQQGVVLSSGSCAEGSVAYTASNPEEGKNLAEFSVKLAAAVDCASNNEDFYGEVVGSSCTGSSCQASITYNCGGSL